MPEERTELRVISVEVPPQVLKLYPRPIWMRFEPRILGLDIASLIDKVANVPLVVKVVRVEHHAPPGGEGSKEWNGVVQSVDETGANELETTIG